MITVLMGLASTLLLAWGAYAIARYTYPWPRSGLGWWWVSLLGVIALAQWFVNLWIGNPLISPIVVSMLYLLSLVGLVPEGAEDHPSVVQLSCWFRRGLVSATVGTGLGVALWAWWM